MRGEAVRLDTARLKKDWMRYSSIHYFKNEKGEIEYRKLSYGAFKNAMRGEKVLIETAFRAMGILGVPENRQRDYLICE